VAEVYLQLLAAGMFDDGLDYRVFDSPAVQVRADLVTDFELSVIWLLFSGWHAKECTFHKAQFSRAVESSWELLVLRGQGLRDGHYAASTGLDTALGDLVAI
jgi:hypothetical protein